MPVITAHGLRHSAANLLLNERGGNIRELQPLLGHRNLATTTRYTHIDRDRLRGVLVDGHLPATGGAVGVTRGSKNGVIAVMKSPASMSSMQLITAILEVGPRLEGLELQIVI